MRYINLHTHRYSAAEGILEVVNQYPHEFNDSLPCYSLGIHPWFIEPARIDADLAFIRKRISDKRMLAIGECGLDKRSDTSFELQLEVFDWQLRLAQESGKPLIIHCVAAFDELLTITKRLPITIPMIIHGFSKSSQLAAQLIDNGFYLSFGKYLLRNPGLEKVFANVPADRLFLETDTVEEDIRDVYALAARYRSINVAAMADIINRNYNFVFDPK